jgi:hypothetical protein
MEYNKYSIKCKSYIDSNIKIIDLPDNYFNSIQNSDLIKNFSNIISNTKKSEYDFKVVNNSNINKLHEKSNYPLLYIYFCALYDNNILDKYITNLPDEFSFEYFLDLYRSNNLLISNILNKINKSIPELKELSLIIYNPIENRQKLHTLLYDNPFVSLDIQHHAEICDMEYKEYILDDGTKIYFYIIDHKHKPNINLIIHIIKIMNELSKLFKTKIEKKPEITLFCGLQKKFIDNNQKFIYPDNANSGSCIIGHKIMIWRYEEIYKVLLHELIHFYNLDFYSKEHNNITDFISNNYCINGSDSTSEAYTELLAVIIHTLLISNYTNTDFAKLLWYELIHSSIQITKLLNNFNLDIFNDIHKKNDSCQSYINQKTSVFSYYIIKTALLFNLDKSINLFNLIPIVKNLDKYIELIDLSLKNEKFILFINKLKKNIILNNDYIKKNLRMTCLQIN